MVRRLAVAMLVLLVGFAAAADAATFSKQGGTIYMSGRIGVSDPLKLSRMINRGADAIVLDSPGGLVAAGTYMAKMIRKARLTTIVRGDCASACTIMYYAGVRRELSGRLGVHQATDAVGTQNYTAAMRRFGAPRSVLEAARATPSNRITWVR